MIGLAFLFVLAVPLVPDEKLIRLKLQFIELTLLAMLAVAGVQTIFQGFTAQRSVVKDRWVLLGFLAWVLSQGALWLISAERALANAEWRRVLLGATAFLVFYRVPFNAVWRRRFAYAWALSGALAGVYGVLQFNGGIGVVMVPQMDRVMGMFGNPIFFAAYLAPTIFVTWGAFLDSPRKNGRRFALGIAIGLQAAALLLTQTRAAWIALVAGALLFYLLRWRFNKIVAAAAIALLLGGAAIAQRNTRLWTRDQAHLLIWRDTVRMWVDHPWRGVGPGAFHVHFPAYAQADLKQKWPSENYIVNYAHNEYAQTLAETGVAGTLPFFGVIGLFFISFYRKRRFEASATAVTDGMAAGIAALLVQNFFSVDARFGVSFAFLFLLMGAVLAEKPEAAPFETTPVRFLIWKAALAVAWVAAIVLWALPAVVRPYRAEAALRGQKDFFDVRLLDPAKTIADLENLAERFPDEIPVLEKLAFVYAKEIRWPDKSVDVPMARKAIAVYERVIALSPDHMGAFNNMANIYYTIGETERAVAAWRQAVRKNPRFVDGHLNLGKVMYVRGDLKAAASHFQSVLEADPGNNEAIVYLKKMVE